MSFCLGSTIKRGIFNTSVPSGINTKQKQQVGMLRPKKRSNKRAWRVRKRRLETEMQFNVTGGREILLELPYDSDTVTLNVKEL